MVRTLGWIVASLLISTTIVKGSEINWVAIQLKPHYLPEFNESEPIFEIRTLNPTPIRGENPFSVCLLDSVDVIWQYKKKVHREETLQHASLALAVPGNYDEVLTTSIWGFRQSELFGFTDSRSVKEKDGWINISSEPNEALNLNLIRNTPFDASFSPDDSSTDIESTGDIDVESVRSDGTIFCSSKENIFCRPATDGVNLLQDLGLLIVNFDQDTNVPKLDSEFKILNALDILPVPAHNIIAEWRTPRQLILQLNESDVANMVVAHNAGNVAHVLLKYSSPARFIGLSGKKTVRTSELGNFHFFVVDSKTGEVLSNLRELIVSGCPNRMEMLPSMTLQDKHKTLRKSWRAINPIYNQNGILAVTGKTPIVFGNAAFPVMTGGSWSLSFWIRLLEIPTGTYRSIFYKGSGDNVHRTPSAWLLPDSNKLTVRVSTLDNSDTGLTSNAEILMNMWTMLTFVFQNESVSDHRRTNLKDAANIEGVSISTGQRVMYEGEKASNESLPYKISLYINGQLDLSAQFFHPVLANEGNLLLFKDPSFTGPKSFVQGLKMWQTAVSLSQIQKIYTLGPHADGTVAVNQVIDVLQSATNPLLPFFSQDIRVDDTYSQEAARNNNPSHASRLFAPILSGDFTDEVPLISRELKPMSKSILEMVIKRSKDSILNCERYESRLDMHLESAELGAIEGTYHWAKLLMYGFESADSQCGFSALSSDVKRKSGKKSIASANVDKKFSQLEMSIEEIDPFARDSAKAVHGFVKAVERGHIAGILPLAFSLIHGIGLESLIYHERPLSSDWDIPETIFGVDITKGDDQSKGNLRTALGKHLTRVFQRCGNGDWGSERNILSLSKSVVCNTYFNNADRGNKESFKEIMNSGTVNDLALGLIFIAALHNDAEAQVALSYRYEHGVGGVSKDVETALLYLSNPTIVASEAFHAYGAQPIIESDRINDQTVRDVAKGHQGSDDEMIQFQIVRAKEGDVNAMLAMGDLYYYGARGLPRDQEQALQYYTQAANAGDPNGMCGAANMYLKGEGAAVNVTKAIQLYESATANGSVRAYNGLGYLYFYGNQVEKNETKAFQYFLVAASFENDGDALFNTGYCLEHGIGVTANLTKAIHYYSLGAQKVGHFQSIKTMGQFTVEGKGVPRSAETALMYLNAAKSIGPWASWLRRGFDLFLAATDRIYGDMDDVYLRSLFCYLYAGELGYEVAQSNAAYILRAKLPHLVPPVSMGSPLAKDGMLDKSFAIPSFSYSSIDSLSKLQLRQYTLSGMLHGHAESYFHLGNCFFTGKCGLLERNYENAIYYYHLASYAKNGMASAYLGVMYHFGIGVSDRNVESNMIRAERYYQDALSSGNIDSIQLRATISMLQKMLSWKKTSSFSLLNSFHYSVDYVIKTLWAA